MTNDAGAKLEVVSVNSVAVTPAILIVRADRLFIFEN